MSQSGLVSGYLSRVLCCRHPQEISWCLCAGYTPNSRCYVLINKTDKCIDVGRLMWPEMPPFLFFPHSKITFDSICMKLYRIKMCLHMFYSLFYAFRRQTNPIYLTV